jgi:hypothetical protein
MRKVLSTITVILMVFTIALVSHVWTMQHLNIETDGDGDSAFITCAGLTWFYGINGYAIDADGTMVDFVYD